MSIITRNFSKMRGNAKVDYLFQTISAVRELTNDDSAVGKLCKFLAEVHKNGIPESAQTLIGVSELPPLIAKAERRDHPITEIAASANVRAGYSAHDDLQKFFLENDFDTIATECPVWDESALGHIDLLQINDGIIYLWDYKPNAHRETKAASQILRYRKMLAKNTGIELGKIVAGYFDDKNAFFLTY